MEKRRIILATQTTDHGDATTLALTRESNGCYRVGLLSEDWRLTWLPDNIFWTYLGAHARFEHEARERG